MLRTSFLAVALVALLVSPGSAVSQTDEPAAKLYQDAMDYVQKGNFAGALPLLQKAVSDSAGFVQAQYNLGVTYERLGAIDSAKTAYNVTLSLDSTLVSAHYSLATIALRTQDYATAVKHLKRVTELDSTLAEAYLNLGAALDQANDLDGALVALKKAIQVTPDYVDAYYQLAATQYRKAASAKDYPQVIATYKKALELGPSHASASVAHFYLARMYLAEGQNELAVASADQAINIKPDFAQAYFAKGKALTALGKDDEAVAAYKKAIEKKPPFGSAHHELGRIYQKKEQWELALREYKMAAADSLSPQAPAAARAVRTIEDYLKKKAAQGQ